MTRILSTYLLVVLLVLWEGRTDAFQSLTNAAASIGTTTATRNDGPTLPTTETSVVTAVGQSRRNIFGVAIAAIGVGIGGSPALAERSLGSVTESYKRYVPRMEAGFAFLGTDLKEMIENQDKAGVVAELTAEKGTKISAMKGTMKIFATAFSDSVVSQSTRELQLATLKTTQQLDIITEAMNEGDKDKALNAHRQAVFFAQVYSEIANACIPRGLEKIRGPTGVGERLRNVDPFSSDGAF